MDRITHDYEGEWEFSTCTVQGELKQESESSGIRQNYSSEPLTKQNDDSPSICSSAVFAESLIAGEDTDMRMPIKCSMEPQPSMPFQLGAPCGPQGKAPVYPFLTGQETRDQLVDWAMYGCLEPSVVTSVERISSCNDAMSLVHIEDTIFVLLGATAELGPFDVLSKLGANIAVVSRHGHLSKIPKLVYDTKSKTNCTLYIPVRPSNALTGCKRLQQEEEFLITNYMSFESAYLLKDVDDDQGDFINNAGADIITDIPEIIKWILSLVKPNPDTNKSRNKSGNVSGSDRATESSDSSSGTAPITDINTRLVICNMASLAKPEDQILVTASMDLICESVCRYHRNTSLVYYVSPNTAHCVSEDASKDSERRFYETPMWQKILQALPTNMAFEPQGSWPKMPNTGLRVCNGVAGYKGHYYTLSKTSQMWRAMLAKSEGHVVSANLCPNSRTDSMISSKFIKFALEGMQIVPPLVAFDVAPARTLMATLMLYDLNCKESTANPDVKQHHPMCLFEENAVHGGTWRCPYTVDSMGQVSYVVGRFCKVDRSPLGSLSHVVGRFRKAGRSFLDSLS